MTNRAAITTVADRGRVVRRARQLNVVSIGYNTVEAGVVLTAGVAAGSVSLISFGLDSIIEVSASLILTWRLAQERRGGCTQPADRRATRAIGVSFAALAIYTAGQASFDLASSARPEASTIGIIVAALSLLIMPALAKAKQRLGDQLGSRAQQSEAAQTRLCAWLSVALLVGLVANSAAGWWWADPLAALVIAALAAVEAVRTWRADDLADTCCA
jgi:divalent metal cation (Fe/Co/Zn/Cd) transporter